MRYFTKLGKTLKLLSVFLIIAFMIELVNTGLSLKGTNNMVIFHFFTLVQFVFFTLLYRFYFNYRAFNWISIVLIVGYIFFHLISINLKGNVDTFNSLEKAVSSMIIITYTLFFYIDSLKNIGNSDILNIPEFWISTGALIYFSGTLFLFLNYTKIMHGLGAIVLDIKFAAVHGTYNRILNSNMEGEEFSSIDILIFGTFGMLILVMGLVIFVLVHRKKLEEKRLHLQMVERSYQSQLIDAVVQAKEKEQERIAKELHDDVGSKLTAIKLNLNSYELGQSVKSQIDGDLKELVIKIRDICNDLFPVVLQELGICDALRNLCRTLEANSDVTINYKCFNHESEKIEPAIELAFFRIVQESLSNILKHGNCSSVEIYFSHSSACTRIELIDDGIPFDRDNFSIKPGHFGLKNIESRLQQVSALFEKDHSYANGNRVTITKYYE